MSFRILVTGSSGFIGSAVSTALAADGHSVRAASRRPGKIAGQERIEWMKLPNLETDVDWEPFVEGMDVVIHLAGIAHRSESYRGDYDQINRAVIGGLVQACRRHGVKRLIFMSSIGAQTGSACDHVATEFDEPNPVNEYGRAKLAAEIEIQRSGVPYTILRPVIVYGPGVQANFALLARLATLPVPLPFAAFKNERSLLSIENLLQVVKLCLSSPETLNQVFIVSDPEPITLADLLRTLREAAGRPPRLFSVPPVAIRAMVMATGRGSLWDRIGRPLVVSSAKLQRAGWSPQIKTKAGLQAMVRANARATQGG